MSEEADASSDPIPKEDIMYRSSKIGFFIMRIIMSAFLKLTNLKIDLKNHRNVLKNGEIFLLNHFIRAETALPQYLLYCADTNIRSFAVAHSSFFSIWWLGPMLRRLGAVPHNHPKLMELLIGKISEGYKVVIFPQGKMVKSQETVEMKTGAAVLALGTDIYKRHIRDNPNDYSDALQVFSEQPTTIVPCNITYYPIRVTPNKLSEFGKKKGMPEFLLEEMTVEGNMFIYDTTMQLNFGEALLVDSSKVDIEEVTDIPSSLSALLNKKEIRFSIRDQYSEGIYTNLNLHLGHIFSEVLYTLSDDNYEEHSAYRLKTSVTLSCLKLDVEFSSEEYQDLIDTSIHCGLISDTGFQYKIEDKLKEKQDFQRVRIENPLSIYRAEISRMIPEAESIREEVIYSRELMKRPFKLTPEDPSSIAGSVLLIHGLYATPNQCRKFAEKLRSEGYEVTVPALAGHGTSAEELRDTTQRDWCDSVFSSLPKGKFHLIGFSTGGLIAAKVAAELSERVISLSCICTPQKFVHKGMSLAKIARKVNFPKYWDNGDNPETYNKIPVSSVCELQELVQLSKGYFSALVTPTVITQTTKDPIVDPVSGQDILELLTHNNGNLSIIDSNRHDIDSSEESVLEFIGENNE